MTQDILGSIFFYLLPISLGLIFTRNLINALIVGILGWFVIFGLCHLLINLLGFPSFFPKILIFLIIIYFTISVVVNTLLIHRLNIIQKARKILKFRSTYYLLGSLIFSSLVYFLIWKVNTPYPLQLNWDIYEHILIANRISKGEFAVLPSQVSDTFTFNSYTSMFHVLLSFAPLLFKTNLIGVYWWIEFWHFLLVILATYFLTKKFFQKDSLSFFSAILSGLIFESSVIYSSLFLIPQTLTSLLGVLILINIKESEVHLKGWRILASPFLILSFITLFLMHFILGPIIIGVILFYIIFITKVVSEEKIKYLVWAAFFSLVLSVLSNLTKGVVLTDREEARYLLISLKEKSLLFSDWYSVIFPLVLSLGAFLINKYGSKTQKIFLALGIFLFAISFLPISYFLKFFTFGRYFITIIISVSFYYLLIRIPLIFSLIASFWIVLSFVVVFYLNIFTYKEPLYFQGYHTHISKNEITAANWLIGQPHSEAFIISDPATQYILEGVSGVNSQGGAFMSTQTRQTLINVNELVNSLDNAQSGEIRSRLLSIKDELSKDERKRKKTFYIVGGRYFTWQKLTKEEKLGSYYNIWRPQKIDKLDFPKINYLSQNFKVLFQNDELVVLEI